MNKFFALIVFFSFYFLSAAEKPFVVVIPSYNNSEWHVRNLDSVFSQNYSNYRVIYVDDRSEDGNGELVENYIREAGQQQRTILIKNQERVGSLANLYRAIHLCRVDEIVVDLDGDDWLAHDEVLSSLNNIYSDPDVWVTYGQFAFYPCGSRGWCDQVPEQIIQANAFREYPWVTTALRTFYAGLFHKIHLEDLYYGSNFFPMAGDLAFMFPILEMAGTHSRFIKEVLYIYNVVTPINDVKRDPVFQQNLGFEIRGRKKYTPVESPY